MLKHPPIERKGNGRQRTLLPSSLTVGGWLSQKLPPKKTLRIKNYQSSTHEHKDHTNLKPNVSLEDSLD